MDRSGDRHRGFYHIQADLEACVDVHRVGIEAMINKTVRVVGKIIKEGL